MANTTAKPLDRRISTLISNSVRQYTRSFFLIVGNSKQQHSQIVNLHYLLSNERMATPENAHNNTKYAARPNVLWCYKKELGFTSNRKKREAKAKRDVKRGIRDEGEMNPFELFVTVTDIRYCYYKDTEKILGQSYGMLVLQDFEAMTPNLLARTIETVQGGGIVVLLLQSLKSLKQLYTMTMDVHSRYRTESMHDPIARFNERFILSLSKNENCLVLDDELNVLPISAATAVEPVPATKAAPNQELVQLKNSLRETQPVGSIVDLCLTTDQAKALLTFTDAIQSKSLSSTVTLTSARGRGKSAALGLAIALAVAHSYSNIFVTSPSPENLKTVFEFIVKGLKELGYEEHLDFDVLQSSNQEWKDAIVRVNIFKEHRQTIQYIQPSDAHVLGQAELVVIDEAAAIPLPLVRKLMGPYLVFLASTVHGYEGTGRSLSLKLIQGLRELNAKTRTNAALKKDDAELVTGPSSKKERGPETSSKTGTSRSLSEIELKTPIRYGANDKIESWLNGLLCLAPPITRSLTTPGVPAAGCPHPSTCTLYFVNRDTLFSFHPASEVFLQRCWGLMTSSHYKNTPNDLQLLSDAPGHELFVLLPEIKEDSLGRLPDPLAVVQIAFEGSISKQSIMNQISKGARPSGDLIPWTISQQYQDDEFASLSGARIVRIAVHPDYAKMGYGTRALQCLDEYYSGKIIGLDESNNKLKTQSYLEASKFSENTTLDTDTTVKIRDPSKMPPLLLRLSERPAENLQYLGTSFGLTPALLRFWKKSGYVPLYVRQTENDLTGEFTNIMIKALVKDGGDELENKRWLSSFAVDFRKRFITLLSYKFREFPSVTALSVLEAANHAILPQSAAASVSPDELRKLFSPHDLKRLTSYGNNMLDYHVILDLLPSLSNLYFTHQFPQLSEARLSAIQSSILLSLGLQRKSVEDIESELSLPVAQVLALFVKATRKLLKVVESSLKAEISESLAVQEEESATTLPQVKPNTNSKPLTTRQALDQELRTEGDAVTTAMREQQRELIDSLDLTQYAIDDEQQDWTNAENHVTAMETDGKSAVLSVKGTKRKAEEPVEAPAAAKDEPSKKKKKHKKDKDGKKKH